MRNYLVRLAPVFAAAAVAITMGAGSASAATMSHPTAHPGKHGMAHSRIEHARAHHADSRRDMLAYRHMMRSDRIARWQPPVEGCPALFFCGWTQKDWTGAPAFKQWKCGIYYPTRAVLGEGVGSWVNNQVPKHSGPSALINFKTGHFVTNPPVVKSQQFLWRGSTSIKVC